MKDSTEKCCGRKRRRVDDEFFARGNRVAHDSGAIIFYTEERHDDDNNNEDTAMEVNVEGVENTALSCFPCSVPGCKQSFRTILECEQHFDEQHAYQCGECHEVFSCNHLLELHLQEVHDSYFAASVERNQASFKCLVESCAETFSSPTARHAHLQQQHDYPKWFRFTSTKREDDDVLKKKQKWLLHHHQHSSPPAATRTTTADNVAMNDGEDNVKHNNDTHDKKKKKKKKHRRQEQKKKRASIPCRYYLSKEGCWRGDSCMFLHSSATKEEATNDEDGDVNMTSLAQDMQHKAKVSVPDKICFGRRRKGPY